MPTQDNYISKIKIGNTSYDVKDEALAQTVSALQEAQGNGVTDHLAAVSPEIQADLDEMLPTVGAIRDTMETNASGSVSYYASNSVEGKFPTVNVVKKIIELCGDIVTQNKLTSSATGNKPIMLGNSTAATSSTQLYFDGDFYYDTENQELVAPHITQSSGGNYYVTRGTTTPTNSMTYSEFGLNELYVQYDE